MADNTLFLTPLLASCGAIAAFLGARHQHISSLIRKKTEYVVSQYDELKTNKIEEEEFENIMAQVILFSDRNRTIEAAVFLSLLGGVLFAITIVIGSLYPKLLSYLIIFISPALIALALSLCLAVYEFNQSNFTLDLEIFLSAIKHSDSVQRVKNLSMYGDSGMQQAVYLKLLERAKDTRDKKQKGKKTQSKWTIRNCMEGVVNFIKK